MKIYANDNLVYDKDFTETPLRAIYVDTAQGRIATIPIANQDLPINLTFEFISLANMVVPTLTNREELLDLNKKVQDAVDDESNFDDEKASKANEKEARAKAKKEEENLNAAPNENIRKEEEAKKAEAEANADAKRKDEADKKLRDEADKKRANLNHPNTINPITPPHSTTPVQPPAHLNVVKPSNEDGKGKK